MELKLTPLRVGILIALIVGYTLIGGLVIPGDLPRQAMGGWVMTILLFLVGAILATVVDHRIKAVDRTTVRWFYVVAGLGAMTIAVTLRIQMGST